MTVNPTVPNPADADVQQLIELNNLSATPVHVAVHDLGYKQRHCHISSKHHAIVNGGKRVHGWAVWRWAGPEEAPEETILFAEHHSVYETPEGNLIDVTPPVSGANKVLFVRDDNATIRRDGDAFLMRTELTNSPAIPRVFQGSPTQYEFWPLSAHNNSDAVAYANCIGFDLSRLETEPEIG